MNSIYHFMDERPPAPDPAIRFRLAPEIASMAPHRRHDDAQRHYRALWAAHVEARNGVVLDEHEAVADRMIHQHRDFDHGASCEICGITRENKRPISLRIQIEGDTCPPVYQQVKIIRTNRNPRINKKWSRKDWGTRTEVVREVYQIDLSWLGLQVIRKALANERRTS